MLLSFLSLASPAIAIFPGVIPSIAPAGQDASHDFTLRHIFHRGLYRDPDLHRRIDIRPETPLTLTLEDDAPRIASYPHLNARSQNIHIERLADRRPESIAGYLAQARCTGQAVALEASAWTLDELPSPNVTDKDTIVNLATMAANAYDITPGKGEWEDVGMGYNHSISFGWEGDGLRGHIFADEGNKTVIVGLKGTSPAVFDGDGTTTRDKLNDNLFFSCCCGQGGQYFWRQVCDCSTSTYTCNSTCLVKALKKETRYYQAAIDLYTNVTELYPNSNVWVVGHSLGGAVSALLGLTFGVPVVAFEAPGEALAAVRLGLPAPPHQDATRPQARPRTGIVHIGHTADPVFMGTCNGATATCTLGGYAMETQCHTGVQCVYDTVEDLGWRVGIGNHKIHVVIDDVLKKYNTVPPCAPDPECQDCYLWKYYESNGSEPHSTTTKSSTTKSHTHTKTRTSTCKTPGWWGCLDESTTTGASTSTSITTTSTSPTTTKPTCKTPGWFGCKDPTTTTPITTAMPSHQPSAFPTSTQVLTTTSVSTSCVNRGWFGCRESTSTTITTTLTTAGRLEMVEMVTQPPPRITGLVGLEGEVEREGWNGEL